MKFRKRKTSPYIIFLNNSLLRRFHGNMMRMEDTHPGITEYFEKGMISIRRTNKPFSRIPIDLTVEKIANADAAI